MSTWYNGYTVNNNNAKRHKTILPPGGLVRGLGREAVLAAVTVTAHLENLFKLAGYQEAAPEIPA